MFQLKIEKLKIKRKTHIIKKVCILEVLIFEFIYKTLYKRINRSKELPKKIPKVGEVNIWLGKLGGYLDRNGDGPPGIISIWRDWSRLQDMVEIEEINGS